MYSPARSAALALPPGWYHRAPMTFRLQYVALNASPAWHTPRHRLGTGPYPSSSKLRDSGQMPESTTPMMTSSP
jgi:hypothetical protein